MNTRMTLAVNGRFDAKKERRDWWVNQIAAQGAAIGFVVWVIFLLVMTPSFGSIDNVMIVLRQAAIYSVVAIGITMVMILGELDISFGSAMSVGGVVGAIILVNGHGLALGLTGAVLVGAVFGAVNALLINVLRIPSVVATLATLGAGQGVAQLITQGSSVYGPGLESIAFLTRGYLAGIPVPVILAVVMYFLAWILLSRTRPGAHIYAIGDNEQAAYRAGINVRRIRTAVFIAAGSLAGVAGLLLATRLGRAAGDMGVDALFPVLTAVILGGVSIEGGRGRVFNTLIASVFLAAITNGLILLGVNSTVQMIIQGGVLVAAVSLDRLRR